MDCDFGDRRHASRDRDYRRRKFRRIPNGPSTSGVVARGLVLVHWGGLFLEGQEQYLGSDVWRIRGNWVSSWSPLDSSRVKPIASVKIVLMSKREAAAVRIDTIAVLDAVEVGVVVFSEIFREVAAGTPLDPQRAENFAAQCSELLRQIGETRNVIRLSAAATGVH